MKKFLALLLAGIMALALVACGNGGAQEEAPAEEEAAATEEAATTEGGADLASLKFGFVVGSFEHTFY